MADNRIVINWTLEKLEKFKVAYEAASNDGVFIFEGHEFLKSYSKYLIEYLEGIIK
jgi:hypothetical protein